MSRPPRIALTLSRPDSPERIDSRDYAHEVSADATGIIEAFAEQAAGR